MECFKSFPEGRGIRWINAEYIYSLQQQRVWVGLHCLLLRVAFPPHPHLPWTLERGWLGLLLGVRSQTLGWRKGIRKKLRGREGVANLKILSTTTWHWLREFASNGTTTIKAFAICLWGDWTLCCCSWRLSIPTEGVQDGGRPSVFQGIWWDRALDRYFQEPIPWSQSLHLFISIVVQSLSCVHSLRPQGLQHARLPCSSPSHGVCSNSCPLSWWCHPIISSSVVPFSSCPQSFPALGSVLMSHLCDQVAKVLEFQLQHQSFRWIFRTDFL